jgi:hypothetical protein
MIDMGDQVVEHDLELQTLSFASTIITQNSLIFHLMFCRSCLHTDRAEKMLVISSYAKLKANDLRSLEEADDELDLINLWEKNEDEGA